MIGRFQSLFLWNIYFNLARYSSSSSYLPCFNPYFYGTSTSTNPILPMVWITMKFQSLFLWNIYFNLTIRYLQGIIDGMFQSLFLWNIYFNMSRILSIILKQYVSILIFMEHLLQLANKAAETADKWEFQSLFLWNIYFNFDINFSKISRLYVSILIFMEHLLQQTNTKITENIDLGFNPYFYGTSTSTNKERERYIMDRKFQSLFLWNIYFNIRITLK